MQTPLGLTLMGLAIIIITVTILIRGRTTPLVPMTIVPVVGALIAGFGFGEIGDFFEEGLGSVMNVVAMFIFAIIFFGILQDVGLFNPVIRALITATRGNVIAVTVGTAAIGIVAHLDGSGSTTFLLTIPALLPLYTALHISRYVLVTIVALAASVMNMVPWGGPLGRAGSVVNQETHQIWMHLLPIQGVCVVMVLAIAAALGVWQKRRIAKLRAAGQLEGEDAVDVNAIAGDFIRKQKQEQEDKGFRNRTGRVVTILNVAVILLVLVALLSGLLPPAPAFLLAATVALLINFDSQSEQTDALRRHAPNALSMAGIILAAAMFLGVLNGAGMLEAIAQQLIAILPASVGPYLHVIIGLLGVPLDLMTSTDAYYFSILPIVQETVANFGVSGMGAASALIIGNVIGTFVSPFSPALWLALGLARADMGKYLKIAFPLAWAFSVAIVLVAFVFGLLA
ncbi:CitMHS family transporter [Corynebacterium sp. 32222D000AT]|uniref:CitMHS family transporter n=1 Tax=unclassified Corynebacterium TaxID=2624378 RepID=UPI002A9E4EAB|nr:citrate:proton symporter [Mycobacteriaceae bacterium]MDY5829028.1 citrate:proton symporter [Corynebacterium sp.]